MLFTKLLLAAHLIFLNHPESVRQPGVLGAGLINSKTRFFWHFTNKTQTPQVFHIGGKGILYKSRLGWACYFDPSLAGKTAAQRFMQSNTKDRTFSININVPSNKTISGILEGTCNKNTWWNCRFGNSKKIIGYPEQRDYIEKDINIKLDKTPESIEIGDSISYGTSYILNIKNSSPKIKIEVSPRGGNIFFVYNFRGVKYTGRLPVYSNNIIFSNKTKEKEKLEVIPIGGVAYPVKITFIPIK